MIISNACHFRSSRPDGRIGREGNIEDQLKNNRSRTTPAIRHTPSASHKATSGSFYDNDTLPRQTAQDISQNNDNSNGPTTKLTLPVLPTVTQTILHASRDSDAHVRAYDDVYESDSTSDSFESDT